MEENIFIMKRVVGWSMLKDGFSIDVESRSLFNLYMKEILQHGTSLDICIRIQGEDFKAKLKNINFNPNQWSGHKDIIQIRYSEGSPIVHKLRQIFSSSFAYLKAAKKEQINTRKQIKLPEDLKEYIVLSLTPNLNVFNIDCFTVRDAVSLSEKLPLLNEEDYEYSLNSRIDFDMEHISAMEDLHATIEEKERLVKVRKVDRSIINNLKYIYDYKCQISGEAVGKMFGESVVEAHHIDYFTRSQNNDASNIIILSPNYHRIIHKNNPRFNRKTKCFEFENGEKLGLKINLHL